MTTPAAGPSSARGLHVGVSAVLAVAAIGFFTGIRGSERTIAEAIVRPPVASISVSARNYGDMRQRAYGPNAGMYDGAFARLSMNASTPVPPQTEADRLQAIALRAKRRAYDGAPPVVPHAVAQFDVPACLTCHEGGAKIGDKVAPRLSHAPFGSCVQCHAVGSDPRPLGSAPAPLASNSFVGMPAPSAGTRAWPGAPPTIPHSTWMRDDCASCHGPTGVRGVRSTHPWRVQCVQCHAKGGGDPHVPKGPTGPIGWGKP